MIVRSQPPRRRSVSVVLSSLFLFVSALGLAGCGRAAVPIAATTPAYVTSAPEARGNDAAPVEVTSAPLSQPGVPFPHDDARTAISAARRGLLACRRDAPPTVLHATLEFAPDGRVQRVGLAPAGGPVAACVREDLARIEIPRFDGPPVSMQVKVDL